MELAELEAEVAEVCGVLNAAHARLVSLVADALATDVWQGWGIHSPAQWVAWQTGLSPARATQIVHLATRRAELPATMAAFSEGSLAVDQVAVVARRVPAAYEAATCELAKSATVAQLRRVVNDYYPFDEPPTELAEPAERCSFHTDDDGRFHLQATGDIVGGATVEAALREAKDALFQAGEPDPTWWDALVEIAERSLAGVRGKSRRDRFRVQLHVDITDPEATRARFTTGVPVPGSVRDRLLCDADVQPVWVRDHVPIGLGRSSRVVPERVRRVVVHRDHGQCQVPGCARRRVEIHHVAHWSRDAGPTETWNLLSLCPRHHRLHHQGELRVSGNADRPETLQFTDAAGRRVLPCGTPRPGAEPVHPAERYEHPSGERLRRHWITLDPRPG